MAQVALQRKLAKSGSELYERMKSDFDYSQIIWTIRRYNTDISEERAAELVDAFLQWISLVPGNTPRQYITMFQSPVEEAFHCFVLNTRLYRQFCEEYLEFFFHHDPLAEEAGPEVVAAAEFTVTSLEQEYGATLHEELREWRRQFNDGSYKVACVGPGGGCHT